MLDSLNGKNRKKLLKRLPKTDLHVHLDGSPRLSTVIELAKEKNVPLPSLTEEGLRDLVFKEKYPNLEAYLKTFGVTCSVMMEPEHLERIGYELARDNMLEGVRYVEPRFAPQLLINEKQDAEAILTAVNKGLEKAGREFNARESVKNGSEPPFRHGIVVCAMRSFGPWSDYYRSLLGCFRHSPPEEAAPLAALELARCAARIRDEKGLPLVAIDLAGAEAGNPASRFAKAYDRAGRDFFSKTVHAGEADGAESVFQAVMDLNAERIGHGCALFLPAEGNRERGGNPRGLRENLREFVARKRITVEACITSNLQTLPRIGTAKNHPLGKMLESGLSVSVCTDNRLTSRTTVCRELELMLDGFGVSAEKLRETVLEGFEKSFFPGTLAEKNEYVRLNREYYDRVFARETGEA